MSKQEMVLTILGFRLKPGPLFSVVLNLVNKIKFNLIALRKAKIVYNFGLSDCSRVKPNIS